MKTTTPVLCNNCSLDKICFPRGLSKTEINHISEIIKPKKVLQRGEYLFRQGDKFTGILAVKSGTAKLITDDPQGNEHILNSLLPGELLGFDGFFNDQYNHSAIALETLSFCELPATDLDQLIQYIPGLSKELFRHSSEEIKQDKEFMVLTKRSADERLAYFLISLSDRLDKRGFSAFQFTLSLTRQEIGNHLGLALETISRLLKKFQQDNLIEVKNKHITIMNISRLRAVFSHVPSP